jgi:hypothetical protein
VTPHSVLTLGRSSGCVEVRELHRDPSLIMAALLEEGSMSTTSDTLRDTKILTHGSGAIPAVGFGTLIPDPVVTKQATRTALEVGFRHLDCAERYRNEAAVGDAPHHNKRPIQHGGGDRRAWIYSAGSVN